jgi:hypothetical protein
VCTKKKSRRLWASPPPSLPVPPFLAPPTSELPSAKQRRRRRAGGRRGGEPFLFLLRAHTPRPDSTRSSQPRASAAPAFFSICAGEFGTRELPSHSSISALGARLGLRSPRSVRIWRFRSVLGAALTGCDLKGGGLAQDLGRFLPLSLCIHLGCSHV